MHWRPTDVSFRKTTAFACLLLLVPVASAQHNIASRPVGFVRVSLADGQYTAVSLPFSVTNSAIDSVLAGQLTGTPDEETSDMVLKWDTHLPRYIRALKADGTGNPAADGKWYEDIELLIPSDMTIEPGEGFFVLSRAKTNQTLFLAGEIILDASNTVVLAPALNLIGYPFSTFTRVEDSALPGSPDELHVPEAPQVPVDVLEMGKGYWYDHKGETVSLWTEIRPYANLFPANDNPPSIRSINVIENGMAVSLAITCCGAEGEKLDVYYQDATPSVGFACVGQWKIASADISPEGTALHWSDIGTLERPPVTDVYIRYYLVGRSDIDSDGDGIPDAREVFLYGTNPNLNENAIISAPETESLSESMPVEGTNTVPVGTSTVVAAIQFIPGKIIYVDQNRGDDSYSGRAAIVVDQHGPKKTVASGLQAAQDGDMVIIKSGNYGENLTVAGRNVSVVIGGEVNLIGLPPPVPEAPVVLPPSHDLNITNTISSSTNNASEE